jgi:hypothetical protein
MSSGDLDLRISIFEGSAPRISALLLHARLTAAPGRPPGSPFEYQILGRDAGGCPPSWMSKSDVSDSEADRLVVLLGDAGLPRRAPRVVANESLLGEGPYLALEVRARGRCGSLNLPLENAGFSGEDAGALRAALRHLAELAPAGRRPAVRELMERLAVDRVPVRRPGGGLVPIGPGWPAGGTPPAVTFGAADRGDDRRPISTAPRRALADRYIRDR